MLSKPRKVRPPKRIANLKRLPAPQMLKLIEREIQRIQSQYPKGFAEQAKELDAVQDSLQRKFVAAAKRDDKVSAQQLLAAMRTNQKQHRQLQRHQARIHLLRQRIQEIVIESRMMPKKQN